MLQLKPLILLTAIFSAACLSTPNVSQNLAQGQCANSNATLYFDFSAAGGDSCRVLSGDKGFVLSIAPEDADINPSPWYAFKISPKQDTPIMVELNYTGGKHRYDPKVSLDRQRWARMSPGFVDVISDDRVRLTVNTTGRDVYVAGQEIIDQSDHMAWIDAQAQKPFLTRSVIGQSREGRDIVMLHSGEIGADGKPYIMFVGRQHPPEVTGALAMQSFVDEVLSGTDEARDFRKAYNVVIVPLINPDGVERGYWRHNTDGTDLNRDWGPFAQPETRSIETWLNENGGEGPHLFLDFHSTQRNVFYTQTDEDGGFAARFTQDWMAASGARVDALAYPFERAQRHNSDLPTSKNYMHSRYNIPAITYEVGDETPRNALNDAAVIFAQDMMTILIKDAAQQQP